MSSSGFMYSSMSVTNCPHSGICDLFTTGIIAPRGVHYLGHCRPLACSETVRRLEFRDLVCWHDGTLAFRFYPEFQRVVTTSSRVAKNKQQSRLRSAHCCFAFSVRVYPLLSM
uniref:Uncharacterized protein n=1 Tax=Schistocephalus solidus TaxID=70667 RepID=A0A0V0J360_SCHSO